MNVCLQARRVCDTVRFGVTGRDNTKLFKVPTVERVQRGGLPGPDALRDCEGIAANIMTSHQFVINKTRQVGAGGTGKPHVIPEAQSYS